MQQAVQQALAQDLTIDITTTGRNSGRPRRIEIWFHTVDGRLYITGSPGRRDWYANILAQPRFTFHLKRSARADIPALATPVRDPAIRRAVIQEVIRQRHISADLDDWAGRSPLVEVALQDA